jgi:hypothetical protein
MRYDAVLYEDTKNVNALILTSFLAVTLEFMITNRDPSSSSTSNANIIWFPSNLYY